MRDDPVSLDGLFHAFADETRRAIWTTLGERPGSTTAELSARFPRLSRWAVMKHLAVLRGARLVQTLPDGRGRRHYRDERRAAVLAAWLAGAEAGMGAGVGAPPPAAGSDEGPVRRRPSRGT